MHERFNVVFLEEAIEYLESLNEKVQDKFAYNIEFAKTHNDHDRFKKLGGSQIWEFRVLFEKVKYRLLAFWDKTDGQNTLVIATNGFIKKTQKTPESEIQRAERIMKEYFESKKKEK